VLLPKFKLQFDQRQIRPRLNPAVNLFAQLFRQLAPRATFTAHGPFDLTGLPLRTAQFFGPSDTDAEAICQRLQADASALVGFSKLSPQIIRVCARHL
jgi:hypothetical protein